MNTHRRRARAAHKGRDTRKPREVGAAHDAHLCVVLHDVSPAHWAACSRVLHQLRIVAQEAGVALPVTLLVVPQMHGAVDVPKPYLRWLHGLLRGGHELALHGFTHRDDGPPARAWAERVVRQHYTAGEGEFAALDQSQAAGRLASGRAWAALHGLPMRGFVAPAWLLSAPSWNALADAGFDYTCTLTRVVALPERLALPAPSVVFSTRTPWRRALSLIWNRVLGWRARRAPLLRFELHPGDCEYAAVARCWSALLARALRTRQPLRLHEAAALARRNPGMQAAGNA